jgi:arsenite oxidase small subunit
MGSQDNRDGSAGQTTPAAKSKRKFLKLVMGLGGVATLVSIASAFKVLTFIPPPTQGAGATTSATVASPRIKITNIHTLDPTTPLRFNYPLVDTPNVLLKLGQVADNGVGPDSDIVAYSNVCQHLGCFYSVVASGASPPCNTSFKASSAEGYCCCHGGQYDFAHGGKVIGGPPPRPVPAVTLDYDNTTGDVFAVGMGGPTIFGHGPPGTTDPALLLQYDLQGGDVVTNATLFSANG